MMPPILDRIQNFLGTAEQLGVLYSLQCQYYHILETFGINAWHRHLPIRWQGYPFTFYARYRSTDGSNFHQIFIEKQYSLLGDIQDVKFILDCGAYAGYASIYLLNQFPQAQITAIEPEDENFSLCRKNLSPYGNRVTLMHAGVWSHPTKLELVKGQYLDKWLWSTQVKEAPANSPSTLLSISLEEAIQKSGFPHVDILKMDVEASEKYIFSKNYEPWIGKVRNIAIELHDEECKKYFFDALKGFRYELISSGEITICKNLKKIHSSTPKIEALS